MPSVAFNRMIDTARTAFMALDIRPLTITVVVTEYDFNILRTEIHLAEVSFVAGFDHRDRFTYSGVTFVREGSLKHKQLNA